MVTFCPPGILTHKQCGEMEKGDKETHPWTHNALYIFGKKSVVFPTTNVSLYSPSVLIALLGPRELAPDFTNQEKSKA